MLSRHSAKRQRYREGNPMTEQDLATTYDETSANLDDVEGHARREDGADDVEGHARH